MLKFCKRRRSGSAICARLTLWFAYSAFLFSFAAVLLLLEEDRGHQLAKEQWHARYKAALERRRFVNDQLMPRLFNNSRVFLFVHEHKSRYLRQLLLDQMAVYEQKFGLCSSDSFPQKPSSRWQWEKLPFGISDPPNRIERWKRAFSLAFTTSTTLGTCNLTVRSPRAQLAAAIFGFVGVPFTILLIRDLQSILLCLLLWPSTLLDRLCRHPTEPDVRSSRRTLSAATLFFAITIYVAVGAVGIRHLKETTNPLANSTTIPSTQNYAIEIQESISLSTFVTELASILRLLIAVSSNQFDVHRSPLFLGLFFFYSLVGLSLISLALNLVFFRSRLPPTSSIGSTTNREIPKEFAWKSNAGTVGDHSDRSALLTNALDGRESMRSDDEEVDMYAEKPLSCTYHTVGIFRVEEPLHQWLSETVREVGTQTETHSHLNPQEMLRDQPTENYSFLSHDDVASLLIEDYRPTNFWSLTSDHSAEFV
ncbi:hypothetical protein M3Y95_00867300 [Aphelenchoides besseyi]|nr:hypothetical protein M3Y95_00867300 [Aphelenchoides besseyi]